ncbi:MAG TPA: RDD family protein [Acidimicrobiales bacterium]
MTIGQNQAGGATGSRTPADLGPRFGARVIDAVILVILGALLGLLLGFGTAWLVVHAVVVFGYFVLLDAYRGTTPGKQIVGLRVTGPEGGSPSVGQAAAREAFTLLGAIPFAGPVLALIAWIVIALTIRSSPTRQGKHDELAGGTLVVTA